MVNIKRCKCVTRHANHVITEKEEVCMGNVPWRNKCPLGISYIFKGRVNLKKQLLSLLTHSCQFRHADVHL